MNENRIRVAIAVLSGGVAVAIAARSCRTTHLVESEKRAQIEKNTQLDLDAIKTAAEVVHARIEAGQIHSLTDLGDSLHNEIAFQKIAIRQN